MGALERSNVFHLRTVSKRLHTKYVPRTSPRWRVISRRQYASKTTETDTKSPEITKRTTDDGPSKSEAFSEYMKQAKRAMNSGQLSENSIFNSLDRPAKSKSSNGANMDRSSIFPSYVDRRADTMSIVMDPEPALRENWERSQIVQMVRNDWKISKQEQIRRTERECSVRSLALKTSRKKLGKIARQLVGKTVDEALLQLRFSKKRIAEEVAKHLEHSRNVAIAKWGMGLGRAEGREGEPIKIQLKSGRWKTITDRTEMYISQAFINRMGMDPEPEFRARGKVNILKKPWTSITFVLKEEATRVREFRDREKKIPTKKLWLHLPDRPITAQRQYPMW